MFSIVRQYQESPEDIYTPVWPGDFRPARSEPCSFADVHVCVCSSIIHPGERPQYASTEERPTQLGGQGCWDAVQRPTGIHI